MVNSGLFSTGKLLLKSHVKTAVLDLSVRTYGTNHTAHKHSFDQIVIPLQGDLLLEVAGKENRLVAGQAAVIPRGSNHIQMANAANSALVLDILPDRFHAENAARLSDHPVHWLDQAAIKLVDYVTLMLRQSKLSAEASYFWTELLLDALLQADPTPATRLMGLRQLLERDPGHPWSMTEMARHASVSVSHLHALFRQELNCTPMQWLTDLRITQAQRLLRSTQLSINEIAFRCGYADQSAFTRTFLRTSTVTPSVYRQQAQEIQHKSP